MAQDTRSNIKSHFETGDIPSEGNYIDLIDSFVSIKDHNSGSIVISGSLSSTGVVLAEGLNISSSITASVISASGTGHILGGDLTVGNNISGSGNLTINEITASGNISASGDIDANVFRADGHRAIIHGSDTGITLGTGGSAARPITIFGTAITASGNISASLTSTGSFGRLESHTIGGLSPVTITDDTTVLGNITGSSISASGTLLGNSLNLGGTAVTATATEINKLDGLTTSKAELNFLDGITNTNATIVKGLNQALTTTSNVTFNSLSLGKVTVDSAGNFGETVIAEGQASHFTINEIPGIAGSDTIKSTHPTPTFIRNESVTSTSAIIINCTTAQLAATAFGNNIKPGGVPGFFMSLTNMSTETFLTTSASFSVVII